MQNQRDCLNIGLVLLSSNLHVIGMNDYARQILGPAMKDIGENVLHYHPRKSHEKIKNLLKESLSSRPGRPAAMVIDVLSKVLMINLCRFEIIGHGSNPYLAMMFIDISEQTGAEINPASGMIELKKFPIYEDGCCSFVDTDFVYYIRADGNYCKIFTADKTYYPRLSLKFILKRYAGPGFFRVHKSFIINLNHVKGISRMHDGRMAAVFDAKTVAPVPVSRRRVRALKQALSLR